MNSTVETKSTQAQNAFPHSVLSKPLLLRGWGTEAFLEEKWPCVTVAAVDFPALRPGRVREACPRECGNRSCQVLFRPTNPMSGTHLGDLHTALCQQVGHRWDCLPVPKGPR